MRQRIKIYAFTTLISLVYLVVLRTTALYIYVFIKIIFSKISYLDRFVHIQNLQNTGGE